jgi:hypothetical protein
VPDSFWQQLFLTGHPLAAKLWGPLIGPVISLLSFVCSNYTTILNIIFLLIAAALLVRFFRSGGRPMLKMMGGNPAGHEQHTPDRAGAPTAGVSATTQVGR